MACLDSTRCRTWRMASVQMKRIAIISSDKMLERAVVLALEASAAREAAAAGGLRRTEVVSLPADADMASETEGRIGGCDAVVVLGAAGFVSGRLSAGMLRRCGGGRPEIFVVSWQHGEQTVLGLIESGIDQYMTFPLSLRRLCVKLLGPCKI